MCEGVDGGLVVSLDHGLVFGSIFGGFGHL